MEGSPLQSSDFTSNNLWENKEKKPTLCSSSKIKLIPILAHLSHRLNFVFVGCLVRHQQMLLRSSRKLLAGF